jgi:diguanylate cyclase (GGDEF)-like protein
MKDELVRLLKASHRLPSPPGVALRILELAKSDEATLEDLAQTLSTDPALAGRILKFVNSPQAGLGRSIASLDQAVSQIGFRGVQLMALSFSLVSSGGQFCPGFEFERFWSRSLACAVASKLLAETAGGLDPNEAFITGLLHRIGQIALACGVPEKYEAVLRATRPAGGTLEELEKQICGATHLEVGAWLLEEWKLPETIWQTLVQSQAPPAPREPGGRMLPATIVRIAEVIASLLADIQEERSGKTDEILQLMNDYFDLGSEAWSELYDNVVREWRAYGQLLSVKAGTDKSFRDLQAEAQDQITMLSVATQMENVGMREENQRLLQQARTDPLTGIANRVSLDERLAGELSRAERTGRPLVLCLIDIDHFKKVNDTHGHQTGDEVLKAVARTLDETIRKMDLAARYGGEEFVVLAPECSLGHASQLAERLRDAIAALELSVGGQGLKVTASVGIAFAHWPDHVKSAEHLFHEADAALYQAKRDGRNCCRFQTRHQRPALHAA